MVTGMLRQRTAEESGQRCTDWKREKRVLDAATQDPTPQRSIVHRASQIERRIRKSVQKLIE